MDVPPPEPAREVEGVGAPHAESGRVVLWILAVQAAAYLAGFLLASVNYWWDTFFPGRPGFGPEQREAMETLRSGVLPVLGGTLPLNLLFAVLGLRGLMRRRAGDGTPVSWGHVWNAAYVIIVAGCLYTWFAWTQDAI